MLLFWKLVDETQISQPQEYTDTSKQNLNCIFLSVRANLEYTLCHEGPCISPNQARLKILLKSISGELTWGCELHHNLYNFVSWSWNSITDNAITNISVTNVALGDISDLIWYSCVHIGSDSISSMILKKPSTVQNKNDTSYELATFFTEMKQKKNQNGRRKNSKWLTRKKTHFPAPPILIIF